VIHAVGPVYGTGRDGEADLLRCCYRESLRLAEQERAESIAFPCISTGIFGYPKDEACRLATEVVAAWLREHEHPRHVVFCCFGADDAARYRDQLGDLV
jgi:O-acetyl-ADP-ribose deacetylase (regulator of RNase III)